MMIEVFNRTKYSDKVLQECAEFAHKICGIKGSVAVVFRYHANSTGYIGLMQPGYPYFKDVAGNLKKFNSSKYMVRRGNYNPGAGTPFEDQVMAMATKDGAYGYITVRMPRAKRYLLSHDAKAVMNTILHEMFHIRQYRDKEWALEDNGMTRDWKRFIGYSRRGAAKRVAHQSRPIERHVNRLLKDVQPKLDRSKVYARCVNNLVNELTDEKVIQENKKQKPKFNKYGERMSDYRNVKMKTLRSGDPVVKCPCCGEQAVVLENQMGDNLVYTHIAATDIDRMTYTGYSASECRYTQLGCEVDDQGNLINVIEFGYAKGV